LIWLRRRRPVDGDMELDAKPATESTRAPRTAVRATATGPRTPKQRAGDAAEDAACAHLVANGCTILARNARFREGELDIVAREGGTLLFVEVRLRSGARFGGAGASVDAFKRKRLVRAAQHWLQQTYGAQPHGARRQGWPPCRFDVVTADGGGVTNWIRDAFTAEE
jgi:putative endonuclease